MKQQFKPTTEPTGYIARLVRAWEFNNLWRLAALVYGYNELARQQPTLGAKLYCRVRVEMYQKQLERTGQSRIVDDGSNPIVLQIDSGMRPSELTFRENDIELMREVVRKFDEANK